MGVSIRRVSNLRIFSSFYSSLLCALPFPRAKVARTLSGFLVFYYLVHFLVNI